MVWTPQNEGQVQSRREIVKQIALILILTLQPAVLLCASDVSDVSAQPYDQAAMVVLAPNGPVFAELRISVARRPYRQWLADYLTRQLDSNRSGGLTAAELDGLTERFRAIIAVGSGAEALRMASASDTATSVPVTTFAAWVRSRIPRAFDLSAQTSAADDAVRLGFLLDEDGNAMVSQEELHQALRTLRFRDLDDDQTFSAAELLPYRDPRTQQASLTPDVASLPFVDLGDGDAIDRAVERILAQYGTDGTIAKSALRLSPSQQTGHPELSQERLGAAELAGFLAGPAFHVTVTIQLSDLANRSQTDVEIDPAARDWCTVEEDRFRDARMTIDGIPVTVRARGGGMNDRSFERGFLGQNFVMYDADQSQYLDEAEFEGFRGVLSQTGVDAAFGAVDLNSDLMLSRDEIFAFVERDLFAVRSQIEVSIAQDGRTLFGIVDVNGDRRLSMRELMDGQQPLAQYDLNQDRQFGDTELGTEYVLTIGLGRSDVRRQSATGSMMMQMQGENSADAILPGLEALPGPEWFRRMDRNQDGDVSLREFPGPAHLFHQADTDSDGLISVDEAEAVSAGTGTDQD